MQMQVFNMHVKLVAVPCRGLLMAVSFVRGEDQIKKVFNSIPFFILSRKLWEVAMGDGGVIFISTDKEDFKEILKVMFSKFK